MSQSEEIQKLIQGIKSAQDTAEANFDPMKGRTYIPRMSPAMKRLMVDAIMKARAKRADTKMSKRKKASNDYFAREADRVMESEKRDREADAVERNLEKRGLSQETIMKYGGKIKKYRG